MTRKELEVAATRGDGGGMSTATPDDRPGEEKPPGDRPAHARRVLLRPRTYELLERYCEERETDLAEEVNRAIREMLEREGRWKPAGGPRRGSGEAEPVG